MSDILDDLDSPWPAYYALQPKNSSERYDVIHAQEVKRQAAVEIRRLREQVSALAEQNEKFRQVLPHCSVGASGYAIEQLFIECLSLPDITTPTLNRFKREGMLEAAEIGATVYAHSLQELAFRARIIDAICARADELYLEVKP